MRDMEDLVESGQGRNPAEVLCAAIILVCCLGIAVIVTLLAFGCK